MRKMAEIGGGAYLSIDGSGNNLESKLNGFFDKLQQIALSDIVIKIDDKYQAVQAKSSSIDIFAKESLVAVFKANNLPKIIEINAKYNNKDFNKVFNLTQVSENKGIATFWSRRKIEDLYDKYLYKKLDKLEQEITQIALNAHLVSKFTSLVAVDIFKSKKDNDKNAEQNLTKMYVKAGNSATNYQSILLLALILFLFAIFTKRRYKF